MEIGIRRGENVGPWEKKKKRHVAGGGGGDWADGLKKREKTLGKTRADSPILKKRKTRGPLPKLY